MDHRLEVGATLVQQTASWRRRVRMRLRPVVCGRCWAYDRAGRGASPRAVATAAVLHQGSGSIRMGLRVTFVSGPRGSGKSSLIDRMIKGLWPEPPHYFRLAASGSDKHRPAQAKPRAADCGVASARWLDYDEQHIFEILPQALAEIHRKDRYGSVVIEADADPTLRCAYPYDHRVFVMPLPESKDVVFRDPSRAATELKRVLDDTAVFASEIFGLFEDDKYEDVDASEPHPNLTKTQMRGFLYSPLGDELATRIQLQPPYHGLVESDVIVVNTRVGRRAEETDDCLRRIAHLLKKVRGTTESLSQLFFWDSQDANAKSTAKLFDALAPMCQGGS